MTAAEEGRWHVAISDESLSVDAAHAFVTHPSAGATVVFTGVVRDHSLDDGAVDDGSGGGRPGLTRAVTGLDYEAYTEVAERRMADLAREAARRWPSLCAGWLVHRVGSLAVGEPAVVVAVSSPHRHTAFEAGRYLIDTLKETVPIWKKEHWADGGHHWPGTD